MLALGPKFGAMHVCSVILFETIKLGLNSMNMILVGERSIGNCLYVYLKLGRNWSLCM